MSEVSAEMQIGGRFKIKKYSPKKELLEEYEFSNLIMDSGLDAWLGQQVGLTQLMYSCAVGTGTTAPAVTQTSLVSLVGNDVNRDFNSSSNSGEAPWWHGNTSEYTFNTAGDEGIDGVSLSEIGIFTFSGNVLWSRELIRDGNGDPTTITLLADEVLVVTYSLRLYVPMSDVTGTFTADGETWDYTLRAANADSGDWGSGDIFPENSWSIMETDTLGSITDQMGGTNDSVSASVGTYTPGTFERTYSCFVPINDGNFATGIGGIRFGGASGAPFQMIFSRQSDGSKLVKTSDFTLSFTDFLTVTVGRYTP